ncbi:hypothetical protein ACHHYP_00047 [Achlya hypogyna]|uniref:VWFA domain-containing protein n=1 Tax=Achlya hypogyna TaxID=1202772 RepID=A0A1V9ZD37_ACHHY|nr:hypothetical protein ACHHYP_00047 [Achlya hypogyna]
MSPLAPSKILSVSSAAEHPQIAAGDASASTFVNCHIVAPACDDADRKPIDLVVVLDRSGSMAGSKLDLCKQTMTFLAKELSAHDRVALVSYDTYVTTDLRLTKMTAAGKTQLASRVEKICAGSCTNLSGGLLAGLDEIQSPIRADGDAPNPVQSVLLLTDGHANEGVSTKDGLVSLLEGVLTQNVSLFTFGYGSDHDANLLRQLSDLGRGSYYFVQNLDGVSLAFADCLGGLLSVVAQNIKVDVNAMVHVSIAGLKTKRPVTTITPSASYEIDVGDMYAQEERDILVQLTLDAWPHDAPQPLVTFNVRYANVITASMETTSSVVSVARPTVVTDTTLNADVVAQKHRIETAEALEAAQREAQQGNLRRGQELLMTHKAKMQREVQALKIEEEECVQQGLFEDLDECCVAMSDTRAYRSRGEQRMASKVQSHWAQRSNDVEVSALEVQSYAMPASAPLGDARPSAPSKYRSSAKAKMMSKAFSFMGSSSNSN